MWTVPREWARETVFIIAGGPSVTQADVDSLKGRRVIVINSSYEKAPWADFLFFGDARWWGQHRSKLSTFAGRIVTVSSAGDKNKRIMHLEKKRPPGLSKDPTMLTMRNTSLHGALNLAAHLIGEGSIAVLGADMQKDKDGRTHHHSKHPWPTRPGCWDRQMAELKTVAKPLKDMNIAVVNCSLASRIDWWPKKPLAEVLSAG